MPAWAMRGGLLTCLLAITLQVRSSAAEMPVCSAQLFVHANGTIDFDNTSYSNDDKLKRSLILFKKDHPNCIPRVKGDKDTRFEAVGKVILMLQQAGFLKVGYLIEPKND